ncbi:integral membrane protein-like protein [Plenodomus tracheiphilus IPT5]|uniref:Integral membrane protein-like protein n=1 Tax=Plenodomus tracheiphilus IPT5 TaxID=1408161 RepID=A0A6A7B5R9_9PLEO|nr:integral membrane protein-like protein [Plenodomus tracheiphilus IPT5]
MRPTALIPAVCCIAALVLSFLCLFAGHKRGFMEGYDLLTLNTSAVGENLLNSSRSSDNPLTNLLNSISNDVSSEINQRIGDVAERLGIEDFYSAHMLNYCYGQYTPAEAANATVSEDDISKNITGCSQSKAMYKFDPTRIVEDALNRTTGTQVTLDDLDWPSDIQNGIRALNALMAAMFILYVIAICLIFLALLAALFAVITSGRLSACLNFLIATLAFLAIGIASALVTAVVVKATDLINKYGNDVGVEANRGNKFLALTWAATGLMLVVLVAWIVEFCIGRRHNTKSQTYAKHG